MEILKNNDVRHDTKYLFDLFEKGFRCSAPIEISVLCTTEVAVRCTYNGFVVLHLSCALLEFVLKGEHMQINQDTGRYHEFTYTKVLSDYFSRSCAFSSWLRGRVCCSV